jgi:DNA-binding MarR family transcriptional regulator
MALRFDPVEEAKRNWAEHWGDDPVPSMGAVTSIMRVQQILLARLNDVLRPFDLTFPRYEALMLLYYSRHGALPLGKMGDRLQVHRTSVTNIVDGLEKSGFVTREPHERDRRTTLANITGAGRRTAAEATAILNELHFGTKPLQAEELDAITRTLERLRADADGFPPGHRERPGGSHDPG